MAAVETVNLEGLGAALARMGAPVTPAQLTPLLRTIAVYLRGVSLRAFAESRSPSNVPWAPLKPATLKRRRKRGKGAKPLLDTGVLRASVTAQVQGGNVLWGSNVVYAGFNNYGTKRIPARPFVEVAPPVVERVSQMAVDFAVKLLSARTLRA